MITALIVGGIGSVALALFVIRSTIKPYDNQLKGRDRFSVRKGR